MKISIAKQKMTKYITKLNKLLEKTPNVERDYRMYLKGIIAGVIVARDILDESDFRYKIMITNTHVGKISK